MTIERGAAWGTRGKLPTDGVVVRSDGEARALVEAHRRANRPLPPLGLVGGDLCRTLGGRGDERRLRSDEAMTFAVDLGAVLVDGRLHWFVAHLVARRSWWRGRTMAVMNAQWLGTWDLGPKSHPSDGLLDVTDADLPFSDRLRARRRLPLGGHVPHPAIHTSRVAAWQTDLDPSLDVYLDGDKVARASHLSVRVEPDALTVVV
jgi:hypothetical protein